MAKPDHKKLALILGLKPGADEPEGDEAPPEDGGDKMQFVKELMESLKAGDEEGFATALEAFVHACSSESADAGEE